jgi:hypothetical protein
MVESIHDQGGSLFLANFLQGVISLISHANCGGSILAGCSCTAALQRALMALQGYLRSLAVSLICVRIRADGLYGLVLGLGSVPSLSLETLIFQV